MNYNYVTDPIELRWKTIDQSLGQVVANAIQTKDLRTYYYANYYTYKEAYNFKREEFS